MQPRDMATQYPGRPLLEGDADPDPFVQFARRFEDAAEADPDYANAMTLATVAPDGRPTARVVLLKGVEHGGFDFFTNYDSSKGRDLAHDPRAALCFFWAPLQRQVRIEGTCAKIDRAESAAYFAMRPRSSQLSAIAS